MTLLVGHPLHKKEFTIHTNLTPLVFYTQAAAFGRDVGMCGRTLAGLQQLNANSVRSYKKIHLKFNILLEKNQIYTGMYIYIHDKITKLLDLLNP